MIENIENILQFWFGSGTTELEVAQDKTELWWSKNKHIDREIVRRFATTTEAVATGELDDWASTPRGLLALIICTDQFPRNMYRDSLQAFAYDPIALAFAKRCADSEFDQQLKPIERVFAYLPFEHSEILSEQHRSILLYQALVKETNPETNPETNTEAYDLFGNYYNFAQKHFDIVAKFGRFPHRNDTLGRLSSKAERTFLKQPGTSF